MNTDEPLYIYVDVDDTLVRKTKNGEEPIPEVIEHVKYLSKNGCVLFCWSTGGENHARSEAQRLGIANCFKNFLPKPHMFIDDQRSEDWKNFLHVCPDRLKTVEEYRSEVKKP